MNKYELALHEVQSVLNEMSVAEGIVGGAVAKIIVERLIAKGVIQSTIENDLKDYRTGPLEPGRTIIGGTDV